MDKSWVKLDKLSPEYRAGVKQFILTSKQCARNPERVICPCAICRNLSSQTDDDLEIHLLRYGFDPAYDIWWAHGEEVVPSAEVVLDESLDPIDVDYELPDVLQMNKDAGHFCDGVRSKRQNITEDNYKRKAEEAEAPLYPGCKKKYTKTKQYSHTQWDSRFVKMEAQLREMNEKYKIIEHKYKIIKDVLASKFGVNLADHVPGKGAHTTTKNIDCCEENSSFEVPTSPMSEQGSSHQPSIHDKCTLINWNENGQEVAKGFISSIDPEATVQGSVLGPNCYRIAIEEVLVESAGFYCHRPKFANLGDALGSTIAWPIRYIVFDD